MSKFKLEVTERQTGDEKTEHYHAEIEGYDVIVTHRDDRTEISVAPIHWNNGCRLPLLHFCPKNVCDIEALGDIAGALFASIAQELRAFGKEDLRGEME